MKYPYQSNPSRLPKLGELSAKQTEGSYYSCKSKMRQKVSKQASPRGVMLFD